MRCSMGNLRYSDPLENVHIENVPLENVFLLVRREWKMSGE